MKLMRGLTLCVPVMFLGATTYGGIVTDNLVLMMSGADAGPSTATHWEPIIGKSGGGELDKRDQASVPVFTTEGATSFYRFDQPNSGGSSVVGDVVGGTALDFDYSDDFTVDVWYRAPTQSPWISNRGMLISSMDAGANGWRLNTRDPESDSNYFFEFAMRDNTGSNKTILIQQGGINVNYDAGTWHNIVVTYDGNEDNTPDIKFWLDGVLVNGGDPIVSYDDSEADFINGEDLVTIGGRNFKSSTDSTMPFNGDIADVRVYSDVLTNAEITQNYSAGVNALIPEPSMAILLLLPAALMLPRRTS
ncbi:LamG domain-containing protein [Poriferisphaera sp. WC338]|uniref:LamG domain-containing protein n=1 Tax=Poriferisphaera sp. WC338 TaxID=3425129 RepID=UPI003D819894